jgi:histidyl-tRNA synthetase
MQFALRQILTGGSGAGRLESPAAPPPSYNRHSMPRSEPIRAVRGVRDLLPKDRALWRTVETAAARVARSFGYQEIVTPIIEHAELIERVGEDTDAVRKELYRFEDRGGRQLALRPEATAGVVRAYFEGHLNQEPQPVRLFLIGPMFRYNRPQKGRYRQFFQFNMEAIGAESPALDAEVIELAATWLHELGLRELRLELNSIGDGKCRPAYLELLRAYYRPLKDRLHGECQARLETNPLLLLDCKVPQCQPFKAKAPRVTDHLCEECSAAWSAVRRQLDAAGIEYHLDPHLVRGLDYYTRTVFEFYPARAAGSQDALGGGGRYDGLAEAEGWPSTPGVGFASGLDRVTELVASGGAEVIAAPAAEVVVLAEAGLEVAAAEVARICRSVRTVAVDYEPKSLKAKMRSANKLGARWVLLLSADEAARRVAQLRDMASGDQVEVAWDQLPDRLA